ncbi:MAG TPA: hypothetical protein VLL48_09380 [Longimicrobiales bacterium]|nr:hypothetical protein [Longimicrobiales bacterium]
MAGYQRKTALGPDEVLDRAEALLPEQLGLARTRASDHEATFSGEEGTVTLTAHRHGPYTSVTVSTDRLRTSRMDYEIQKFLTELPYEPGDSGGRGSGDPS